MTRLTAGVTLPGGFVVPPQGQFMWGADDVWGYTTAGGNSPSSSPHAGIETSGMLDRRMAIRNRHRSFKTSLPGVNEAADAALRSPRVIPMGTEASTTSSFPVTPTSQGAAQAAPEGDTSGYTTGGHTYYGFDRITQGQFDSYYTGLADAYAAVAGPVFFRPWQEFNIPHMPAYALYHGATIAAGQAKFIAAWQHVYALFQSAGATNVNFIWCPTASTGTAAEYNPQATGYYPGDAYVQIIGIDIYDKNIAGTIDYIYQFALTHSKPVLISEGGWAANAQKAGFIAEAEAAIKGGSYDEVFGYVAWNEANGSTLYQIDQGSGALAAYQKWTSDAAYTWYWPGPSTGSATPTAPTSVLATALSSTSISVAFSGATDTLGAIEGYNVYAGGSTLLGNFASSPAVITGLTPNTTYSITVKAEDVDGNLSSASSSSSVTTQAGSVGGGAVVTMVAYGDLVADNESNVASYLKSNYYSNGKGSGLIVLGDNAYNDGSDANFTGIFDPAYGSMLKDGSGDQWIFPATGSHDFGAWGAAGAAGSGITGYKDYFKTSKSLTISDTTPNSSIPYNGYYYDSGTVQGNANPAPILTPGGAASDWAFINLSGVRGVTTNTDTDGLMVALISGSAQYNYLKAALQYCAAHNLYVVISSAHCYYSCTDTSHSPEPLIKPLWDLLALTGMLGKSIVLGGHHHNYQRFVAQDNNGNAVSDTVGTRQFVVGTGGLSSGYTNTNTPANWGKLANGSVAYTAGVHGLLELTLGTTGYSFRFINTANGSVFDSGTVTLAPLATTPMPQPPTSVTATTKSASTIQVSWAGASDPNGSIGGYQINRTGTGIVATIPVGTSTYLDTGLSASTAYTYSVQTIDTGGTVSGTSSTATATTLSSSSSGTPSPPTTVTAVGISTTQIQVAWSGATDSGGTISAYIILRNGAQLLTVPSTAIGFTDSGLAPATAYTYTIKTVDSGGAVSSASSGATGATIGGSTGGGAAFVQAIGSKSTTATTTLAATFGSATASGNCIVVATQGSTKARGVQTVTDDGGNNYIQTGPIQTGTSGAHLEVWVATNVLPASKVTVTRTGTDKATMIAAEFSGVVASSPLDQSAGTDDATVASTHTSPSVTTLNATDLLIAVIGSGQDNQPWTPSGSFTESGVDQGGTGCIGLAYQPVTATGTYSTTFTAKTGTTTATAALITIALKANAGTGGGGGGGGTVVDTLSDFFSVRTVANGWGTADDGYDWTVDSGTASKFAVSPTGSTPPGTATGGSVPVTTVDTNPLQVAGVIPGGSPTPQQYENNFAVHAQLSDYANDLRYVGGFGTLVGTTEASQYVLSSPTTRNHLYAETRSVGGLKSWNPAPDNDVQVIIAGPTGYVVCGGEFANIGGSARSKIALISDATSGTVTVTSFNAGTIDGRVTGMDYDGTWLYLCGEFTHVNGTARNGIARVNASTGVLDTWNPGVNGSPDVRKIKLNHYSTLDTAVYVCGEYTGIGGGTGTTSRLGLAALDPTSGTVLSWNPDLVGNGTTTLPHDIDFKRDDGSVLLVAVAGADSGADGDAGIAYKLISNGVVARSNTRMWKSQAQGDGGDHNACGADDTYVAFGHHGNGVGGSGTNNNGGLGNGKCYIVKIADGSPAGWIPTKQFDSYQGTYRLELAPDQFFCGGVYTNPRQGVAVYDRTPNGTTTPPAGGGIGGQITLAANATDVVAIEPTEINDTNYDVTITFKTSATPAGASHTYGVAINYVDTNNMVLARMTQASGGHAILDLNRVVGGTFHSIGSSYDLGTGLTTNTQYAIRLIRQDATLETKLWLTSSGEPTTWGITGTDSLPSVSGGVAVRATAGSGYTANAVFTATSIVGKSVSDSGGGGGGGTPAGTANAEINHARWIVRCPNCNNGIPAPYGTSTVFCDVSNDTWQVNYPPNPDAIAQQLAYRDRLDQIQWNPSQTVSDLAAENVTGGWLPAPTTIVAGDVIR